MRNARSLDGDESRAALQGLCQRYWYPLYAYLRRQGCTVEDAQDITQDFIASLLRKNSISRAAPEMGRFRAFLLGSLKKFVVDWRRRAAAKKRGGDCTLFSLDCQAAESRYRQEPIDCLTPELIYHRRWALTLINSAVDNVAADYQRREKSALFSALRGHLDGNQDRIPLAELVTKLGMTEGAIKVAAHRLRQRYRDELRRLIANTVSSPEEVADELAELFRAVGRRG